MPSENHTSQSQARPALYQRISSSIHSESEESVHSSTPPQQHAKPKTKHVASTGRIHSRVPSNKGLHKLTKAHGTKASQSQTELARNSSHTALGKKSTSQVSLKRNRSSADVRPKSSEASHGESKRPTSVHFEIGDQEPGDEGWEEASSSASPVLSRSASRAGGSSQHSSQKPSANNSQPQSPISKKEGANGAKSEEKRYTADAKVITERLLQRTQSHNTTKMSLATATPEGQHSPNDDMGKSQTSTANGTPKADQVSRFVGGSGTPSENSPFLNQARRPEATHKSDEVKRAASMGNLVRRGSEMDDEEESALAPSRSRKSSTSGAVTPGGHAYNPPQNSRTQQKLWLQRASSNIEPQQMAPGVGIGIGIGSIGLGLHHGNSGFGNSLVGAGYDGKDPRVRLQLERTGLEYLVVRRHQDPVGLGLDRLRKLPGMEKSRRIPHPHQGHAQKKSDASGHTVGLSQSLRDARVGRGEGGGRVGSGSRHSFEVGSQGAEGRSGNGGERDGEDGVGAILRGLWEKGYEMSASTD